MTNVFFTLLFLIPQAPFVGINCDLVWEPKTDWERIINALNESGAECIRLPIRWCVVEPRQGEWNFSTVDDAINAIPDSVEILATLMSIPSWANGVNPDDCEGWYDTYPPKDLSDWEVFVKKVVDRYKGRIRHWEIWNEQNGVDFFRPRSDASKYTELLKAAYLAVKQVDSDCQVVLGGLQMNGIIPSPWSAVKVSGYLEDLYKLGAQKYFDICNIHPYVLPDEGAEYMMQLIHDTLNLMEKYGDKHKPLWITEVGAGINDHDTAKDQATLLANTFCFARKELRIQRVFWFLLRDTEENILGPEETMGIVTRNFEKKPAFFAFQRVTKDGEKAKPVSKE
ncbi:MAG TPA: cellulase family glycosylhydrolase [Candidatus Hydrogenedentes bacterium]|nr:cellulase family glycosylhydrolase [Candidatus Hydrogenedentota bacterium]HOL77375.1 cellulase family glycosylhydrolase [Candidatus Hydrogenedentota bacterium]HPO84807.1 cellulase family glycosylhydrolase [Candidatus Hydrogenedentota bacterium]